MMRPKKEPARFTGINPTGNITLSALKKEQNMFYLVKSLFLGCKS